MEMTIISRDTDKATARLHFEHAGVTLEQDFDLVAAVPGTAYFLGVQGRSLTPEEQDRTLDYITSSIERQIDSGAIQNPPAPLEPDVPLPDPVPEGDPPAP